MMTKYNPCYWVRKVFWFIGALFIMFAIPIFVLLYTLDIKYQIKQRNNSDE